MSPSEIPPVVKDLLSRRGELVLPALRREMIVNGVIGHAVAAATLAPEAPNAPFTAASNVARQLVMYAAAPSVIDSICIFIVASSCWAP
jgi:hypothetical protein